MDRDLRRLEGKIRSVLERPARKGWLVNVAYFENVGPATAPQRRWLKNDTFRFTSYVTAPEVDAAVLSRMDWVNERHQLGIDRSAYLAPGVASLIVETAK